MQQVTLPPASCLAFRESHKRTFVSVFIGWRAGFSGHHVGSNLQYFSFDNLSKQKGRQNVSNWYLCVVPLLIHLSVREVQTVCRGCRDVGDD